MGTIVKTTACFGASSVCGVGDQEQHRGWPGMLAEDFYACNPPTEIESQAIFYNLGKLGEKAHSLADRVPNELAARHREGRSTLSIFSTGLNDSFVFADGSPITTPEKFVTNVERIVQGLAAFSDHIMYVGFTDFDEKRTQPYRGGAIFMRERARVFEHIATSVSNRLGAITVPLFAKSQEVNFADSLLHSDGLHPDAGGHAWIYDQIKPVVGRIWSTETSGAKKRSGVAGSLHAVSEIAVSVVVDYDSRYLLTRDPRGANAWDLPTGKVFWGETLPQAADRVSRNACGEEIQVGKHLHVAQEDASQPIRHAFSAVPQGAPRHGVTGMQTVWLNYQEAASLCASIPDRDFALHALRTYAQE